MSEKYYVGIDLGGTFIKGGIVTKSGEMLKKGETPTQTELGADKVIENIANLVFDLLNACKLEKSQIVGIGMGVPGMIDGDSGVVVFAGNFGWTNLAIAEKLQKVTGIPVKITNDANAAALGEAIFGSSKEYNDSVFITLGTGVGGGVIINKKIFAGNKGAGAEIGHMVIKAGGESCTCGLKGCFESYSSATALIRDTKRAMLENKNSKMWEVGIENVTGKTPFDYASYDESAKQVIENYLDMLALGLINVANIFRPQAIIIGGGVSKQKGIEKPLQERLNKGIFAGDKGPEVKIMIASLQNDAGTFGASALFME